MRFVIRSRSSLFEVVRNNGSRDGDTNFSIPELRFILAGGDLFLDILQPARKLCTELSARLESKLKMGRVASLAAARRFSFSEIST